ncbi:MAG: DUF1801 domain-containing protein [Promicromonosporaceae bacterium]|nr:DUF1801 domain-containing protein [Promicromonosporaceae bacterium]
MAKEHPHLDGASVPELRQLVLDHAENVRETYIALHELIVDTLPDVRWSVDTVDAGIGYGAHQFGYNGWGMAAVEPHSRWVNLQLLAGARLPDPADILVGTAAAMRHVKLHNPGDVVVHGQALRELLTAASVLNQPRP